MRYKTVIFDLDGTLTDSAAGILDAAASALDKMGFPRPAEATLRRDRKSTRLNSSHPTTSRMPSSA